MDCVKDEQFGLPDEHELGLGNLFDVDLYPWQDNSEFPEPIGIPEPAIFDISNDETFPEGTVSTEYPPAVNFLPDVSSSDVSNGHFFNNGTAQICNTLSVQSSTEPEPRESELRKLLLGRPNTTQSLLVTNHQPAIKPLLPVPTQTQAVVSPRTQTLQVQPVLPVQTQNLVFSPQLLTLPDIRTAQVSSPAVSQHAMTVAQPTATISVLHLPTLAPTSVSQPLPFVIDPKQLNPVPAVVSASSASNTATPPKNERHRAHNAIEQKYRKSINNKITELKDLLFGSDAKIQKSGVLKRAIDHIRQLRNVNNRLRQENASFKIKLQQIGVLNCMKADDTDSVSSAEALADPLTPESLMESHNSPPSSPDDSMQTESGHMFDRTRLAMCILMMSFFVFDPFNFIFSWQQNFMSSPQGEVHHGRLLMSEGSLTMPPQPQSNWLLPTFLIGLFVRTFAILFIFLKLFVFGEPSLQPDSKIAAKYWAFKRRADLTLEKGDYIEGSKVLGRCLEILGRPLPTSRLDMTCSLLWHIFRQVVHRLLVTRWLTAKVAQWCSLRTVREKDLEYRQESAKQAALVYHQLHQLYLTGHVPGSQWLVTVVALNAANMADMADSSLNEEIRVDIYIDCAIQLRSTLPRNLKFLARYFLSRARKLCSGRSLTLPYSCWWLFTPVGHRFFVSGEWSCNHREAQIWSTSRINDNKPLANVTQKFCEFLLEQAMSALLLSKGRNEYLANTWNPDGNSGSNRALDLLHTMSECVNNVRKSCINRNLKVFGDITTWPSEEPDLVGCWWAAVGKVAAYWLLGDIHTAQQQYKIIEHIPEEIANNDDPLGQALLMAFRARSRMLEKNGKNLDNAHEILEYCDKGGALLKESLAFSSSQKQSDLLQLMHLLCCDWLLSTRADVWEKEKLDGEKPSSGASRLDGFNKDLRSLQNVASYIPDAMSKVYMYQAASRMMAEANPMKTQRLLQKSVMRQKSANEEKKAIQECSVSAEKDRANALVMASSHLPTSLYSSNAERKDMIIEAVECLQKFGEKDRIARCRKLVMSF